MNKVFACKIADILNAIKPFCSVSDYDFAQNMIGPFLAHYVPTASWQRCFNAHTGCLFVVKLA